MSAPMMKHSRRDPLTTSSGPSIKRKERDSTFNVSKPSPLTTKKLARPSPHHRPTSAAPIKPPTQQPLSNNHLLAGYLANEFLTKGTLYGQPWDPARAEAVPVNRLKPGFNNDKQKGILAEPRAVKPPPPPAQPKPTTPNKEKQQVEKYQRYMEVADLLKSDGAHLPGVVNPTQLARFLQL